MLSWEVKIIRDKVEYSLGVKLTNSRMDCLERGRVDRPWLGTTASSTAATDLRSLIIDSSISEVEEQLMNYCLVDIYNPATEIRPVSPWLSAGPSVSERDRM